MQIACFLGCIVLPFCGFSVFTVIKHFLINEKVLKKIGHKMCVLVFSSIFVGEIFMKIRPVWAESSVRTDGHTDTMKPIKSCFSQFFLNVPYKMIINKYKRLYFSEGLIIPSAALWTTTKGGHAALCRETNVNSDAGHIFCVAWAGLRNCSEKHAATYDSTPLWRMFSAFAIMHFTSPSVDTLNINSHFMWRKQHHLEWGKIQLSLLQKLDLRAGE